MCDRLAVRKGEFRFVTGRLAGGQTEGQADREADFELTYSPQNT